MKPTKCILLLLPLLAQSAQAIDWDNGGPDNKWSTPENWVGDVVPNGNTDDAAFVGAANVDIDVDQSFTIRSYLDGFGGPGFTHLLYGAGALTIDRNSSTPQLGINNGTGNAGGTLRINVSTTINNSQGGDTTVRNSNSSENTLIFDNNCNLTLTTKLQTVQGSGGTINFNCNFLSSASNLIINSDNVLFGADHSSGSFGRDVVFLANSKLSVDGGSVLNNGRKFQVNGSGAELELNAADTINDANVIIAGTNDFLLDVNADQGAMGVVNINNGALAIEVDPNVTTLSFRDSSGQAWGAGSITITGFKENTIRFGTDASGLTPEQLALIDGGAYSLTSAGYLTGGEVDLPAINLALDPFPKITFLSTLGQTYQLQKSGDGALGDWVDVVGQSVVGDGTEKTLSDSAGGPPGETRAFYRVETN